MDLSAISQELAKIERQISDVVRALPNEFQKFDKVKELIQRSRQLEDLTDKLQQCQRSINDFDQAWKEMAGMDAGDINKVLSDKKQSVTKESNSCMSLTKKQASSLDNKRGDLFGASGGIAFEDKHILLDSIINIPKLMDNQMMNETNQAVERSRKAVEDTVGVGAEAAATLRPQSTVQMSRIVNACNSIHFFIKQALLFVKWYCIEVASFPLTYVVFSFFAIMVFFTVLEVRDEKEKLRQGYYMNCTRIPDSLKGFDCSWTKNLTAHL